MFRIGQEEIDEVAKVIKAKKLFRVNDGLKEVETFEKELAEKTGAGYALCLSGGTAALTCAIIGLGIGPGDEVIVPAYTFMATAAAVISAGAVPVLAEIDDTMTIDIDDAEKKLSRNVKAVIPVDMVGFPADMKRLLELRDRYGLRIIEDACQAVGGSFAGKRLGSIGDAGAFSFNDYKIITAGEGGAVLTNDRRTYERALIYHDGGAAFRPYAEKLEEPVFLGTQYRVGELTGAVLRMQLKRLDGILEDLRRIKRAITEALKGTDNIAFVPSNDTEGDCATTFAFKFENSDDAERFASFKGVGGWLPVNSGKHVYSNWEPLMTGRVSHNPHTDPFRLPRNRGLRSSYHRGMCPKTLDILSKTVYISISCDWDDDKIDEIVKSCRKAAASL